MHQSVIHAFQKILSNIGRPQPLEGMSFPEQFAIQRFVKKFEIPDSRTAADRKVKTFEMWRDYDQGLADVVLPDGVWYRARLEIHKVLKSFRHGELALTGGSQSEPLMGRQAIADKLLTHKWEVSPDCADLFVKLALRDAAFIRAAKYRARRSLGDDEYKATVKRIFSYRRSKDDVRKYLLYLNLEMREASRYSTVRKNNDVDRSIDLQPFINMVVQRSVGLGLKEVIKNHYGIDLEVTQPIHGKLIASLDVATIDLKNASDSNTWSLTGFLCPPWFVKILRDSTPMYTEGLDGHYYVTRKVSSMGNGFTFELMTLILLAAARQLDQKASVFGDDIVIDAAVAPHFIEVLTSAGWVTNVRKTFLSGPFRESCGYNFHADYGYVRSYDFEWPETFVDCVSFYNKCAMLSSMEYFERLRKLLRRAIPKALRGPWPLSQSVGLSHEPDQVLDSYFFDKEFKCNQDPGFRTYASALQHIEWGSFSTYVFVPKVRMARRDTLRPSKSSHYMLFLTYMHGGRKADVTLTGKGDWVKVGMYTNGNLAFRAKNLVTP